MKLKKRLSLSYLEMILGAILCVVILCVGMIFLFEKVLLPRISESEIFDSDAFEVQEMMRELTGEDFENPSLTEQFADTVSAYGFDIKTLKNGEIVFSNLRFSEDEALESLERLNYLNGTVPMIYQIAGATMVQQNLSEGGNDYLILAVSFTDISIFGLGRNSVVGIFVVGLIMMVALIAVAILISCLFFSKIIHRKISAPVNALCSAAERIKHGDYGKNIKYEGIEEFENVCETFNDMQRTILEKTEQQQEYEKRRSEVIAGISHDLKTPLTSIKGYVKGLKDGIANTPEKQAHYLNVIEEKSDNMSYLIERLFTFSKLETAEMPLNREEVCISDYLDEYIYSVSEDLRADGIELDYSNACGDERIWVSLDQIQMNRVIGNIIENSKKYNPAEGLKIAVRLYARRYRAVIYIKDNGVGVSSEQLPKLFDSFYRGDESRTQGKKIGSGLGLAISKRIVELHGGTISASSNGGLAIEITLPIERREPK